MAGEALAAVRFEGEVSKYDAADASACRTPGLGALLISGTTPLSA